MRGWFGKWIYVMRELAADIVGYVMRDWWHEYRAGMLMAVGAAVEAGAFVLVFVLVAILNRACA